MGRWRVTHAHARVHKRSESETLTSQDTTGGWPASKAYSRETGDAERANAQRVAQRLGKDNPKVFIPCRHVYTKFGACASQNFLPDAVRTQTRLGHSRDAMRPPHVTPRAQRARDPPHHDMGRLGCRGHHAWLRRAAATRLGTQTSSTVAHHPASTNKHWTKSHAETLQSMVQRVQARGITHREWGISPERSAR